VPNSTTAHVVEITVAALALLILPASALLPVCRLLIRWRAAKLPPGEGADRAREELEGLAEQFGAGERAEFEVSLLLRSRELSREIGERAVDKRKLSATATQITQHRDDLRLNPALGIWRTNTERAEVEAALAAHMKRKALPANGGQDAYDFWSDLVLTGKIPN